MQDRLRCTACNTFISTPDAARWNDVVGAAVCIRCDATYQAGTFRIDAELGNELYCRVCGDGGDILGCDKCKYSICKRCIQNVEGNRGWAKASQQDEWRCYICSPPPALRRRQKLAHRVLDNWKLYTQLRAKWRPSDSDDGAETSPSSAATPSASAAKRPAAPRPAAAPATAPSSRAAASEAPPPQKRARGANERFTRTTSPSSSTGSDSPRSPALSGAAASRDLAYAKPRARPGSKPFVVCKTSGGVLPAVRRKPQPGPKDAAAPAPAPVPVQRASGKDSGRGSAPSPTQAVSPASEPRSEPVPKFSSRPAPKQAARPGSRSKSRSRSTRRAAAAPRSGSSSRKGRVLIEDLSNGREKVPIPVVNDVDDEVPPSFKYVSEYKPFEWARLPGTVASSRCCDCKDGCGSSCPCVVESQPTRRLAKPNFINGWLRPRDEGVDEPWLRECGWQCGCNARTCSNRVVGHGIQLPLEVFRIPSKGWGLRCQQYIPEGTFVCAYYGELLTNEEAEARGSELGDQFLYELNAQEALAHDTRPTADDADRRTAASPADQTEESAPKVYHAGRRPMKRNASHANCAESARLSKLMARACEHAVAFPDDEGGSKRLPPVPKTDKRIPKHFWVPQPAHPADSSLEAWLRHVRQLGMTHQVVCLARATGLPSTALVERADESAERTVCWLLQRTPTLLYMAVLARLNVQHPSTDLGSRESRAWREVRRHCMSGPITIKFWDDIGLGHEMRHSEIGSSKEANTIIGVRSRARLAQDLSTWRRSVAGPGRPSTASKGRTSGAKRASPAGGDNREGGSTPTETSAPSRKQKRGPTSKAQSKSQSQPDSQAQPQQPESQTQPEPDSQAQPQQPESQTQPEPDSQAQAQPQSQGVRAADSGDAPASSATAGSSDNGKRKDASKRDGATTPRASGGDRASTTSKDASASAGIASTGGRRGSTSSGNEIGAIGSSGSGSGSGSGTDIASATKRRRGPARSSAIPARTKAAWVASAVSAPSRRETPEVIDVETLSESGSSVAVSYVHRSARNAAIDGITRSSLAQIEDTDCSESSSEGSVSEFEAGEEDEDKSSVSTPKASKTAKGREKMAPQRDGQGSGDAGKMQTGTKQRFKPGPRPNSKPGPKPRVPPGPAPKGKPGPKPKGRHAAAAALKGEPEAEKMRPRKQLHASTGARSGESLVVDAIRAGNIGRFLNHSCDGGNLLKQSVLIDVPNPRFEIVAFFAGDNIPAYTELTYDYNYPIVDSPTVPCSCGSSECRKWLR